MGSLTISDMTNVDLSRLGTAVADWKKTVSHLKEMETTANDVMLAKSESAHWAGVNAGLMRGFVRKTAMEFTDAHTQAETIWRLLDDAHRELVDIQKKIRTAVEVDAPQLGVALKDTGDGKVQCFIPHVRGSNDERTQEELDALKESQWLADRVASLLSHAMEIDASVTRALALAHGNDPHNFGHKEYDSLDDAQKERALTLARKGTEMTGKEFAELNRIMKYNAGDSDFSTAFYEGLGGPEQTLQFYVRMTNDAGEQAHSQTGPHSNDRLKLMQELQKSMGTALASATDPDNRNHLPSSWGNEFRKMGTEPLRIYFKDEPYSPYGYQALGGLLRHGNYDPRFVNPIVEHITQVTHEDPNFFMKHTPPAGSNQYWGFDPGGAPSKNGPAFDALEPALEALGHSPEAAIEFFSSQPHIVYNLDGTVDKTQDLEFEYFEELTRKDSPDYITDSLGHALEAATTGHSWETENPVLRRDATTSEIMEKVVKLYGATSEIQPRPEMMDSLGRMGAAYIDDLNYSIMNFGGSAEDVGRDTLFTNSSDGSSRTDFGEKHAMNFMMVAAGDEEGYKYLSSAQQVFEASGLTALEGDKSGGITFAENASKVHGILDESRSAQIRQTFNDEADQINLEQTKAGEWRKFGVAGGVATLVGVGTALTLGPATGVAVATAVPLLMESSGEAVKTHYGNHVAEYLQKNSYNNDQERMKEIEDLQEIGRASSWSPASNYSKMAGMSLMETRELEIHVENAYFNGVQMISDARRAK